MTCEICLKETDHMYNADGIADIFGLDPFYDESWNVCADCLDKIESAASLAWRSKVGEEKGGAE